MDAAHRDKHPPVLRPLGPGYGSLSVSPRTRTFEPRFESSNEVSGLVHGRYMPGSIGAYCLDFIDKVSAVFGQHTIEWATIEATLGQFKSGQLSKRQAHLTMSQVLSTHDELQQGLIGLLDHPDARWGVGDFDLSGGAYATPALPSSHSANSPAFLEPQHLPQLTTSMPSDWYPAQSSSRAQPTFPSAHPALLHASHLMSHHMPKQQQQDMRGMMGNASSGYDDFESYGGHNGYAAYDSSLRYQSAYVRNANINWNPLTPNGPQLSSPAPPMPSELPFNRYYTSPSIDATNSASFVPATYMPAQSNQPYTAGRAWQEHETGEGWEGAESNYQHGMSQMLCGSHPGHLPSVSDMGAISHSGSPMPRDQSTSGMAPPQKQSSREPTAQAKAEARHVREAPTYTATNQREDTGSPVSALPISIAPKPKSRAKNRAAGENGRLRASPNSGRYIHAICGRSFSTLNAVKKHHWGAKSKEEHTTSSCWYKTGMPDREWDEHPSCQRDEAILTNPRAFKSRRKPMKPAVLPSGSTTSTNPDTIPSPMNAAPSFPDLSNLPPTVADIVYPTHFFSEHFASCNPPRILSPDGPRTDLLWTAVDKVSRLEAPKPQGRNDSFVSHLDAQIAAAEHGQEGYMPWASGNGLRHQYMHAADQQRLEQQQRKDAALFSQAQQRDQPKKENQSFRASSDMSHFANAQIPHSMILPSQIENFHEPVELEAATCTHENQTVNRAAAVLPMEHGDLSLADLVNAAEKRNNESELASERDKKLVTKREVELLRLSVSPGPTRKRTKVDTAQD